MSDRLRAFPFVLAAGVSAALVLAAPFIGEIRRTLLIRFPGQFVRIIGAIVLASALLAIAAAVVRIRERKALRYAGVVTAVAIAVGYAFITRTDDPQVNAVQSFHFIEYGLVTVLFWFAWRPAGDASSLVLPVLAGLLVGTVEEWFQWFIPVRVGEVRDVFLNGVAIGCGLIFSLALHPPSRTHMVFTPAARRRNHAFAGMVVVVFGAFFQSVHLGYAIDGPQQSAFRSGYTAADLDRLSADRAERWRGETVGRPPRLSAEDQYMTEGHWHVARRNEAWAAGDVAGAWHENLILERYFAPVLDTPSYLSATGHRWSEGHRADAEQRYAAAPLIRYESQAHPSAIHVWPRSAYWLVVGGAAVLLAAPWFRHRLSPAREGGLSASSV
ncbi:MAG: VanZ family protein [Vicinamibacterales bacterium]